MSSAYFESHRRLAATRLNVVADGDATFSIVTTLVLLEGCKLFEEALRRNANGVDQGSSRESRPT